MSDERCDWCLRPAAPEEWESATTGEQRDGYCWGPGDALCDELHEAEWERMRSEVARLREEVAEARRMAGAQWKRALLAETLEEKLRDQEVSNGYYWSHFVAKIRKPLASVRRYDDLGDPYYPDDLEIQLLVEKLEKERATSARLRGLLGEAIEGLQEFVCDDEQGRCPAFPCESEIETKPHCRLAGLLGRLAAALKEKP